MKQGRPTKNVQFQIRRILRPYYQKSISANATAKETPKIPDWVRNIFVWYAEDKIGEDELIGALQFLIKEGIIKI